ncbi:adenosylcobinamide-phosphate synthase [Yoonia tamlensis]|uniref:Cobalamin biosynthesis protein CobD n=1 Tax=Yoonia tamlensis TaxID=390270 RepID=A0A1I6FPF1_9RHOB|nr:adenosylcobinamide-phosphate synthase CbiB [Yoonia tamlensis]SFR31821.1 adenosylcobinamide-phosphate synthase [Yoonia tamlensis]
MILVCGMLLDAIFGEPRAIWSRIPHPAILMGRIVGWCDNALNHGDNRRAKGAAVVAVLCGGALAIGFALQAIPTAIIDVLIIAVLLAQKSLVQHVRAVADALRLSVGDGRMAVAMIVGRDTAQMDQSAIARSAIESAAENLSDGVIAPAFWFMIGGLPGLLIYKITNTADSMIGYRTPRHAEFGWAAARFDDLLNLIPARITALLIWAVTSRANPQPILQEAPRHRSPNAGWPEAAMAHGLGIALSGPRSYEGQMQDFPYVNGDGTRALSAVHIDRAVQTLWKTWALALICAAIATLI